MNITVTARHCEIPDSLRRRARERAERLRRFEGRIGSIELIFDQDGGERRVEARAHVHGSEPILAQGSGQEFRQSLDQAIDRLGRQLKRRRERRRDHQATVPPPQV